MERRLNLKIGEVTVIAGFLKAMRSTVSEDSYLQTRVIASHGNIHVVNPMSGATLYNAFKDGGFWRAALTDHLIELIDRVQTDLEIFGTYDDKAMCNFTFQTTTGEFSIDDDEGWYPTDWRVPDPTRDVRIPICKEVNELMQVGNTAEGVTPLSQMFASVYIIDHPNPDEDCLMAFATDGVAAASLALPEKASHGPIEYQCPIDLLKLAKKSSPAKHTTVVGYNDQYHIIDIYGPDAEGCIKLYRTRSDAPNPGKLTAEEIVSRGTVFAEDHIVVRTFELVSALKTASVIGSAEFRQGQPTPLNFDVGSDCKLRSTRKWVYGSCEEVIDAEIVGYPAQQTVTVHAEALTKILSSHIQAATKLAIFTDRLESGAKVLRFVPLFNSPQAVAETFLVMAVGGGE